MKIVVEYTRCLHTQNNLSMFAGSGVSTDIWTCYAARIMAISILPFIVVQLLQTLHSTSGKHLAVLIGLILSLAILISYCLYQVTIFLSCVPSL
jgi:hypothetical protein